MATKRRRQSAHTSGAQQKLQFRAERVRVLRQRPGKAVYRLPDIRRGSAEVKWVTVGSGPHCDFVIDAKQVAEVHCSLECTSERVTVHPRTGATTLVNKVPLIDGQVELYRGSVLSLGPVRLVAYGENMNERPDITAPGLHEMIEESVALHGTKPKAAQALGIKHTSTLRRWIDEAKFKLGAAVIVVLTATSGWYGIRYSHLHAHRSPMTNTSSGSHSATAPMTITAHESAAAASRMPAALVTAHEDPPASPPKNRSVSQHPAQRSPDTKHHVRPTRATPRQEAHEPLMPSPGSHELTPETQLDSIKRRGLASDISIPFQRGGVIYSAPAQKGDQ